MLDAPVYDPTAGPSRCFATRFKLPDADRLAGVLEATGETFSDLARRLVLVHLDALTGEGCHRLAHDGGI